MAESHVSRPAPRRPGRPPKNAGPATRDLLLDAALELFARQGFAATTVRQIAAEVGVRDSAIYGHFASKQAIYDALFAEAGPASFEALRLDVDALVRAGPRQAVPELAARVMEGWSAPRARRFASVLLRDGSGAGGLDGLAASIEAARDRLQEPFAHWQRAGLVRTDVPARQIVWELFAPLQVPRLLHLHADATPDDLAAARRLVDEHVRFFLSVVLTEGNI
ncbi:TetR/AcrR family transcriptional regulator [Actinomadura sp. WAC 06369]|uniref:TetR/AcrR family transcriptional regulator n=1 Tax=Actinomadura sp. WAC 06369 TaxID=2203193 RepID=UPI000F7A562C|nr:TetR/AcrR family transcriptional regulator [Actinomadura sp. WAC 06369]RSN68968.1 TetR/AcrR family transcriptional regulator [Actinomadura sp. WAC 06369]